MSTDLFVKILLYVVPYTYLDRTQNTKVYVLVLHIFHLLVPLGQMTKLGTISLPEPY